MYIYMYRDNSENMFTFLQPYSLLNERDFINKFLKLCFWTIPDKYSITNDTRRQVNVLYLVRGFIPYSFCTFLKGNLRLSTTSKEINDFALKTGSMLSL